MPLETVNARPNKIILKLPSLSDFPPALLGTPQFILAVSPGSSWNLGWMHASNWWTTGECEKSVLAAPYWLQYSRSICMVSICLIICGLTGSPCLDSVDPSTLNNLILRVEMEGQISCCRRACRWAKQSRTLAVAAPKLSAVLSNAGFSSTRWKFGNWAWFRFANHHSNDVTSRSI